MVTIEQKIKLFSKLVYQEVENEIEDKNNQSKEIQSERLEQITIEANKKAEDIYHVNEHKIKQRLNEMIAKSRIENRRKILNAKEDCVEDMIFKLKNKMNDFISTPEYEKYIKTCIQKSTKLMDIGTPLEVLVNKKDSIKFKGMLERYNFSIKVVQPPIIGGIIIVDPKNNTKVDFSIDTRIEDMMPIITNEIMKELGEVGDNSE